MGFSVSWRYSSSMPFLLKLLNNKLWTFSVLHLLPKFLSLHIALTVRKSTAVLRCSWVCSSSTESQEVEMTQLWELRGSINHYWRWLRFCWKTSCTATVLTNSAVKVYIGLKVYRFIIRNENVLRARKASFLIPGMLQGLLSLRPAPQPALQSGEACDIQISITQL